MALAASLVLIAAGAVLTWATGGEAAGVHLESVGVAVMVAGGATLLAALVLGSERG